MRSTTTNLFATPHGVLNFQYSSTQFHTHDFNNYKLILGDMIEDLRVIETRFSKNKTMNWKQAIPLLPYVLQRPFMVGD
jgi:activator of HSP90 ATPase